MAGREGGAKVGNTRVLIIEREVMISDYLSVSLRERGYKVIGIARNLDEATKVFGNSKPDLIIVDTQMSAQPEMNQVASKIRAEFQDNIPIVFLTSNRVHSRFGDSAPCVTKPFFDSELQAAIKSALGDRGDRLP
jgi:DNA-binding response OmpR family regulator